MFPFVRATPALALLALAGRAFAQDCTWSDQFRVLQPEGGYSQCTWDPDGAGPQKQVLVTCGDTVQTWDGTAFSPPLGDFDGFVYDVAVFDEDGPGPLPPRLFATGDFRHVNGLDAPLIARWDGTAWSAVGDLTPFIDWSEYSIWGKYLLPTGWDVAYLKTPRLVVAIRESDDMGCLNDVLLAWDGSAWQKVPSPPHRFVHGMEVFDPDASGPQLPELVVITAYASCGKGEFFDSSVCRLTPAGWEELFYAWTEYGGGERVSLFTIKAFDEDGTGPLPPALYVGGDFDTFNYKPAHNLARWDGKAWSTFEEEFYGAITRLRAFDRDGAGPGEPVLYIGGYFNLTSSTNAKSIAQFDGQKFAAVGSGITGPPGPSITDIAAYEDGASGPGILSLYVGGSFGFGGSSPAKNLARWNGQAWAPLGNGLNNEVHALAEFDDGSGPRLYAGGQFIIAGGVPVVSIASWDGQKWSPLGAGCNHHVDALCIFDDGTGPALYAGGKFTKAAGQPANYIAKWNGAAWSPLGSGLNAPVRALAVHSENGKAALYAAGEFTKAGGQPAAHIAKWDGFVWSALGSGLNGNANALASTDSGLYVGGPFVYAGDLWAPHVARWSGGQWSDLGSAITGTVNALAAYSDSSGHVLYATGQFWNMNGGLAGIARWKPSGWSPLDLGIAGTGRSLTVLDPDGPGGRPAQLFVGGDFAGKGYDAKNLMAWDGDTWSAAYNADAPVLALTGYDPDGPLGAPPLLAAAGQFTDIDGTQSLRLALLDCPGYCPADCDSSGSLDIDDFICFQTAFATKAPLADCDHDGELTIDDFICFQTAFGLGCP